MKVTDTPIKDCLVIEPTVFEDERGYFFEGFNKKKFKELSGVDFDPVQLNQSRSCKSVLRGFHFQYPPFEQAKLVSCSEGTILDVAVDIRRESKNYGEAYSILLTEENRKQLYIPKGFAHGFLVVSNYAKIMYLVDTLYSADHDAGIRYNDPQVNFDWGLGDILPILSKKDATLPTLETINI